MLTIAQKLRDKANDYEGDNIFEDVFDAGNLNRKESTDYRAVFTDNSMLVLYSYRWDVSTFSPED